MGRYVVGSGKRNRKLKEMETQEKEAPEKEIALNKLHRPVVNQITPVAQSLEMAKSEIYIKRRRINRQQQWVVNSCLRSTNHLWTGIPSDIKR